MKRFFYLIDLCNMIMSSDINKNYRLSCLNKNYQIKNIKVFQIQIDFEFRQQEI